jgi:membrane-bound lytic murein transglycosylase A
MQGIQAWARANPKRLNELLNTNPSFVFFRELPDSGGGPIGALGVPLTPGRSIAVDPRAVPLGAPVFLATTLPLSEQPLQRLVMAQDTGGAIKGAVRADFFWGFGAEAGARAGRMRQRGEMWVLLPNALIPGNAAK